jgi:hypothetical protein
MKIIAGLAAFATATVDRIVTENWWQANPNAPHCGCQIIIDPATVGPAGQYINSTCTLKFTYPSAYGISEGADPHFVSVASSYMVGRDRNGAGLPDGFKFTGFDEVSNPDVLDILVFYEHEDCPREGRSLDEIPTLEQHEIWEVYNVSTRQGNAMCDYELECVDNGAALSGVHLGNFNYDIARSVQTYTVPIYGLEKGRTINFPMTDYYNDQADCMNPLAHSGHGTAFGCSQNDTNTCSNLLSFSHDQDHNGLLEYFQFEPVSPTNNPLCFALPIHHVDDYEWKTPSPWDTQENCDECDL